MAAPAELLCVFVGIWPQLRPLCGAPHKADEQAACDSPVLDATADLAPCLTAKSTLSANGLFAKNSVLAPSAVERKFMRTKAPENILPLASCATKF